MTDPDDLERAAATLAAGVAQLRESVDVGTALRDDLGRIRAYGLRSRRILTAVIVGLVLDLSLTIVAGGLYLYQRAQSDRIEHLQRQAVVTEAQIGSAQARLTDSLSADCDFFATLGASPLPVRVTVFGLRIVSGARNAYLGHGCVPRRGRLPAPDPRLLRYLTPGA